MVRNQLTITLPVFLPLTYKQHMGSREGVAAKIDADTRVKLSDMEGAIRTRKEPVIQEILQYVYNISPEVHKNYHKK